MKLNTRFDKLTEEETRTIVREKVEERIRARQEALYQKAGSKRALQEEASFLAGAMTVLCSLFQDPGRDDLPALIPVDWVLMPLSGRSVLPKQYANGKKEWS